MPRLVDMVGKRPKKQPQQAHLVRGLITGVQVTGRVTVLYRGTVVSNVPVLESYPNPKTGDAVYISISERKLVVTGRFGRGLATFLQGPGVNQVEPTGRATWRAGRNVTELHPQPTQGDPDGGGAFSGIWTYGTTLQTLLGATAETAMSLTVTRSFADSGPELAQVLLHLHNYANPPPGEPVLTDGPWAPFKLAHGETKTAIVPGAWLTKLQTNTAKGFGIKSPLGDDYMMAGLGSALVTLIL